MPIVLDSLLELAVDEDEEEEEATIVVLTGALSTVGLAFTMGGLPAREKGVECSRIACGGFSKR